MKVLLVALLLLGAGYWIYNQQQKIDELNALLSDAQSKIDQLNGELRQLKEHPQPQQQGFVPHSTPLDPTPQLSPAPSGTWMWNSSNDPMKHNDGQQSGRHR